MATQLQISSPKVSIHDGKAVTTTEDVACYFGKQHHHVVQKLESLDCSEQFTIRNFSRMVKNKSIGSGAEREIVYYEMTRNGFIFLVMGFTGKKAAAFKEAYIAEFDRMETELLKPVAALPTYPPFSDDHANRAEIIYYQDFKPIFCRVLQRDEIVMSHESMKEWLEKQGMVFFTREELRTMTHERWLMICG